MPRLSQISQGKAMRKTGYIEYWNLKRGFGFIAIDRSERYFVHAREIKSGPLGDLRDMQASFDVVPSSDDKKYPLAVNVRIESEGGQN